MFVGGKHTSCGSRYRPGNQDPCPGELVDVWETWDGEDEVFVGEQRCQECESAILYTRHATAAEQEQLMAKTRSKKTGPKKGKAKPNRAGAARERKRPRKQALPGMEDMRIRELDQAGEDYADIRDRRMELSREEHALKERLKRAMHKHGKKTYKHDGISIELVATEEDVKVRIRKADQSATDDDPDEDVQVSVDSAPAPSPTAIDSVAE